MTFRVRGSLLNEAMSYAICFGGLSALLLPYVFNLLKECTSMRAFLALFDWFECNHQSLIIKQ